MLQAWNPIWKIPDGYKYFWGNRLGGGTLQLCHTLKHDASM